MIQPSDESFSLKKIAVAAFGPSLLFGIGEGAIFPIIALSARDLDASIALSGLIVAVLGIGGLVSNLPAAMVTSRYGERRAMIGAAIFSIIALILCMTATSVWLLGIGIFMIGMATSVFLLARQSFLIEAVPISMRARAMSTLGGTMRIGMFIGPFAGAALMHLMGGLDGGWWVGIAAMAAAGLLSFAVPELDREVEQSENAPSTPKPTMKYIARAHLKVFLTLGSGSLLVAAIRSSRQIVIPLWASEIGLDPATTALVYGLMGSIDMLLFYPAGKLMDAYGRLAAALPSMILIACGLIAIPFTHSLIPFTLAAMIMGLGNGIASGLCMTIGADASPAAGRREFLGIWRQMSDIGSGGGPVLLSALTAFLPLGAGIVIIGSFGFVAAGVFWRWLPRTLKPN